MATGIPRVCIANLQIPFFACLRECPGQFSGNYVPLDCLSSLIDEVNPFVSRVCCIIPLANWNLCTCWKASTRLGRRHNR